MTERRGLIATAILCAILIALALALTVRTADAAGPSFTGQSSWFGGPSDAYDNDQPASGIPNFVGPKTDPYRTPIPGIALYQPRLLGQLMLLTDLATKRRVVGFVIDLGPAPWTGKTIDCNPGAAVGLGFRAHHPNWYVSNFPTGRVMRATIITRRSASRWAKRTRTTVDDRWIWRVPRR